MSLIIGSVGYLGDTPSELYGLMEKIAEKGDENDFNELERKTVQAIEARKGLSDEEREAFSQTLKEERYEIFRTGEYLNPIYELIQKANETIYGRDLSDTERQEKLSYIFLGGLLEIKRCVAEDKRKEFYEDVERDVSEKLSEIFKIE